MRYPRKLPAGGVHRSDRSWLSSRGLGLYLRTTNLPIRRLYFSPLGEKPARAVRFPVSCWSLGLLNRNGRRRCTVHAVLTGPRRPGRPTAGPRPLFAIGEAAAAGRSSAVHTELMMTSACRAT